MSKIFHVALRELIATVTTKGFILAILLTPVLVFGAILGVGLLLNEDAPKIDGEVAVIDPTGEVLGGVTEFLHPDAMKDRREKFAKEVEKVTEQVAEIVPGGADVVDQVVEPLIQDKDVPELTVTGLSDDADREAEKRPLLEGTPQDGGRLAVLVVHPAAVRRGADGEFGTYELYIREKLDDRLVDEFHQAARESIVTARVEARGLDLDEITALTRLPRVRAKAVTEQGERENTEILNILLPMAFMLLLMMSTMTSGQYLVTNTVEEKSSRVVELLLSAVSPMELLTGKILGQLVVGFVVLALYSGMGMAGLTTFSLLGLLDPMLLVYLVIFFILAYFTLGALMAAIGSAVNEMREAQSLMMPVMMMVMIPWILALPISRNPNSLFSTILSLVPPISSYAMLLRLTSTTPPPAWQVALSIVLGVGGVFGAVWFAAKVFRIGLLMHGKPPNFATLVRWVRMA